MKKRYLLTSLLSASMLSAFAEGDIYVSLSKEKVNVGETVDIIVNLKQDAEEVRNVECVFTLNSGLQVVSKSYNTDRLDGFTPMLNIKNGGQESKVTFMSFGENYIADNDGELFRFTVKANREMNVDFDIFSEIAYGRGLAPTEDEDNVSFGITQPELVYTLQPVSETVDINGEAVVSLSFENEGAVGGFNFDITLPEGMTIAKNSRGKVVWTFSDRVDAIRSVSENWISDNQVSLVVMGVPTTEYDEFISAGTGEVLSFKVYASDDLALDSHITIDNISFSDIKGKQYNQEEAVVVNVKNVTILENALTAIQNQIANVQEAIDNFDAIVADLQYASRYEGEEVTGLVDAARDWVAATTATMNAKYEARTLTMEDGVMEEMMAQIEAVNVAINNAAKYDASRYVQAAVYAWAGDDDEIEGAMEGVLAIIENLPEATQVELLEQINALEADMQELLDIYDTYTAYNEDTHADIIKKAEAIYAQIAAIQEAAQAAWEENQVKPGDINLDGVVDMLDNTTLLNVILERVDMPEVGSERFAGADANVDGKINIADYTAILNIILGKSSSQTKAPAMLTTDETITWEAYGSELRISLDNFNAYTAMQFDVALPENVSVLSAENTLRTQGMSVAFNRLANGMTRVAIFSDDLETISGINGDIVVLNLSAETADAAIENAIAADSQANAHAIAGVATGIGSVKGATNADATVYDLNGRMTDGMKSGVNIIRSNGSAKKILVK